MEDGTVERSVNQLDRIATEYREAIGVIYTALVEWGVSANQAETRAAAIIARLASHDPPILLEMQPKEHAMDEAPVVGCECRMCDSARNAKM